MKSNFPEFYRISIPDFQKIWDECVFIFDANALLNLYRYSQSTCQEFIKILTDDKIKERVWIPHQFALEYQKNRLEVIAEQKRSYAQLLEKIEILVKDFERHPFLKMKDVMQPAVEKIRSAARKHPKWNEDDPIRETLTNLFKNKVGKPFSQTELKKIYEEGAVRYEKRIPPGYLDKKKGGEAQFGDLIGWKQILDQAKSTKKPIIFITNEADEDWWWRINGEIVGARYELIKEAKDFAEVFFCMYNWRLFHKRATKYLKRKIDKKVEREIKEITEKIIGSEIRDVSSEDSVTLHDLQQILSVDVGVSNSSQDSEQNT